MVVAPDRSSSLAPGDATSEDQGASSRRADVALLPASAPLRLRRFRRGRASRASRKARVTISSRRGVLLFPRSRLRFQVSHRRAVSGFRRRRARSPRRAVCGAHAARAPPATPPEPGMCALPPEETRRLRDPRSATRASLVYRARSPLVCRRPRGTGDQLGALGRVSGRAPRFEYARLTKQRFRRKIVLPVSLPVEAFPSFGSSWLPVRPRRIDERSNCSG